MTFTWFRSLGNVRLGYLVWELSLGNCRLVLFVRDPSIGSFSWEIELGSFACEPSRENFSLVPFPCWGSLPEEVAREHLHLRAFVWELQLGYMRCETFI